MAGARVASCKRERILPVRVLSKKVVGSVAITDDPPWGGLIRVAREKVCHGLVSYRWYLCPINDSLNSE